MFKRIHLRIGLGKGTETANAPTLNLKLTSENLDNLSHSGLPRNLSYNVNETVCESFSTYQGGPVRLRLKAAQSVTVRLRNNLMRKQHVKMEKKQEQTMGMGEERRVWGYFCT
eukprot:744245-Hanusia_phi.AAC.1